MLQDLINYFITSEGDEPNIRWVVLLAITLVLIMIIAGGR